MNEKQEKHQPTDIEVFEARAPGVPAPVVQDMTVGPMEIMMEAVQRGQGKDVLEQLQGMFEFQKQIDAEEGKKAFYRAVAEFKRNAPDIVMDKTNKQTGNSPYSSTGNFLRTVNPVLGEHGLSSSFKIDDTTNDKIITVTCVLSHELGHSDSSSMSAEPDTLGPKGTPNKTMIHGRMSTLTQLMRATFSAVTGLAAISEKYDDDGNAAGGKVDEFISESQQKEITKRLKKIYGDDPSMFFQWMGCETVDTITDYTRAKKGLDGAEKAKLKLAESVKGNKMMEDNDMVIAKVTDREPGQEG